MVRTKTERKHNTWTKIFKKLNLIKSKGYQVEEDPKKIIVQPHRLNKNKLDIKITKDAESIKKKVKRRSRKKINPNKIGYEDY